MNFDTGNTFIAGQDPVAFLDRFRDKVSHVHIKDVSQSLAAAARGELTGIAVSHVALGDGVNAANIVRCLEMLIGAGYDGVLSIECEGQGGPMIERSLAWLRGALAGALARALVERSQAKGAHMRHAHCFLRSPAGGSWNAAAAAPPEGVDPDRGDRQPVSRLARVHCVLARPAGTHRPFRCARRGAGRRHHPPPLSAPTIF